MSTTTDFIAELLRAANELDRLSNYERRRLLDRAAIAIRDLRETVGVPESGSKADALIHLSTVAFEIDNGGAFDETICGALLDAAGMIRDLHIVLDTETKIYIGDSPSPK